MLFCGQGKKNSIRRTQANTLQFRIDRSPEFLSLQCVPGLLSLICTWEERGPRRLALFHLLWFAAASSRFPECHVSWWLLSAVISSGSVFTIMEIPFCRGIEASKSFHWLNWAIPFLPSQSLLCHSDRTVWRRQWKGGIYFGSWQRREDSHEASPRHSECLTEASHAIVALAKRTDIVESVIKFSLWTVDWILPHNTSFLSLLHFQGLVSKWILGKKNLFLSVYRYWISNYVRFVTHRTTKKPPTWNNLSLVFCWRRP